MGGATARRWVSRKDAPACASPSVTPEQPTSPDGRPSPSRNKRCPPSPGPACTRGTPGPRTAWTDGRRDRAQGDGAGNREGSASGRLTSCLLNNSEGAGGCRLPSPALALRISVLFRLVPCSRRGQSFVTRLGPSHSFLVGESTVPTSPWARHPPGVAAGKPTRRGPRVPLLAPHAPWHCREGGCTRLPCQQGGAGTEGSGRAPWGCLAPGGAATQSPGVPRSRGCPRASSPGRMPQGSRVP